MRSRLIIVGCLLWFAADAAVAAKQGFYFGLLGGRAEYEFEGPAPIASFTPRPPGGGIVLNPRDIEAVFGTLFTTPFIPTTAFVGGGLWSSNDDDSSTAWGAFAGYRIVRYAAVELSYLDLGTLNAATVLPLFGGGSAQLKRELQTTGPAVSALGILPLTQAWDAYVRAGVIFADMKYTTSINGSGSSTTFGSEAALWGVGTQFSWGPHWSARLDFQRFESVGSGDLSSEADIDLLSLGIVYRL